MSRWRGASSVTSTPPIETAPAVTSSSPAIIRSSVDLPHPDGPDEHHELAVGHLERDVVDRHVTRCRRPS